MKEEQKQKFKDRMELLLIDIEVWFSNDVDNEEVNSCCYIGSALQTIEGLVAELSEELSKEWCERELLKEL